MTADRCIIRDRYIMTAFRSITGTLRLPFLALTPACVLVGVGTAFRAAGAPDSNAVALVLLGAVAAHISVNAFNEYLDFRSGLDARTVRTPFSGGSGVLPANPGLAPMALGIAVITLCMTAAIGIYFASTRGAAILAIGLAGMVLVVAYTPCIVRQPLACLVAPGLGFGPLMIMGTHAALTGGLSWLAFVASLPPFFLVSNLLLLNQFPDVDADRSVGRRHLPIVWGRRRSGYLYVLMLALSYLALLAAVAWGGLPRLSLLGLLTIAAAWPAAGSVMRHAEEPGQLRSAMALNVLITLATPALIAAGLLLG